VTALATLCGAGAGLGLLFVIAGWRGVDLPRPGRTVAARQRAQQGSLRLGLAVGAGVVVGAATGWPVGALLAAGAGWAAPSLWAGGKARGRAVGRVEAIAGWAEMLRDTMAGAAGLEQAIAATATVAPLPIRAEVAVLAGRLEGERLAPALRRFADDIADPTCDLVVAALVLAAEHQAQRLGELLGSLAQAARDQATMRLRVETGRARTRTSVRVVVGATVGLALGRAVLNRGYLAPYDSAQGQLVLVVVGGLFASAFVWLGKISRPIDVARVLQAGPVDHGSERVGS
jgi:tight adherence protein B